MLLDAASPELPAGSDDGTSSGAGRPSTCRSYMPMSCLAKSGSKFCGSMFLHRATVPGESGGFSVCSPLLLAGWGTLAAAMLPLAATAAGGPATAKGTSVSHDRLL